MIKKPEDQWITEFIPQYSPKGRRLYHRKSSLTPIQRLTSDFFERFKEEGVMNSETPETIMGLQDGFLCSFIERDGKFKGLGFKEDFMGNEVQIETAWCPTRKDADGLLHSYIRAYNK